MTLAEIIRDRIRSEGPISFCDFMEMALYYPGYGYYTSPGEKTGIKGDFLTSTSYTPLFGKMIARQLCEMWELLDRQNFTIVEYGAGDGMLCHDILETLKNNTDLYRKLSYCIVEKSDVMKEKEKKILGDKVRWYDSIQNIPSFTGCILSNELIDNFAVHQVVMLDELMEVFVDYDNGFVEVVKPASHILKNYMRQLNIELPKGFRTEINLEATRWIADIAGSLQKGFVLTIDYGDHSSALYQDARRQGTMVCYHKHRVNYCPYTNIGSQDITAHVNFSALHHWGWKNGLQLSGFTNQAYFLLGLGLAAEAEVRTIPAKMLNTFLYDMGRKLKVFIQQKGISGSILSGLRFSQRLV
jgi:SAM-dependent MidA family methyltransferase